MEPALYDRIGQGYSATRRTDQRLVASIWDALGDARSVLNVGAGAGAYEPPDRDVVAVEPSPVMIAQRPAAAAPAVHAHAEELPFADGSFDAAMAVLSDHHWHDRLQGLRELRRVARRRVILFNADPALAQRFWLTVEYLPGFLALIPARYRAAGGWQRDLEQALGEIRIGSSSYILHAHPAQNGRALTRSLGGRSTSQGSTPGPKSVRRGPRCTCPPSTGRRHCRLRPQAGGVLAIRLSATVDSACGVDA